MDTVTEALDLFAGWRRTEEKQGSAALEKRNKHRHSLECLFGYHGRLRRRYAEALVNQGQLLRAEDKLRRGEYDLAIQVLETAIESRLKLIPTLQKGDEDLNLLPHQGEARRAENEVERYREIRYELLKLQRKS